MGMTPWQHGIVQIEIISVERALEDVLSVEAVVVGSLFVIRRLSRWTHTYLQRHQNETVLPQISFL